MYKYINIKLLENILNSVFTDVKLNSFIFFIIFFWPEGELKRTLGYATAFIPLCAVKQMSC